MYKNVELLVTANVQVLSNEVKNLTFDHIRLQFIIDANSYRLPSFS